MTPRLAPCRAAILGACLALPAFAQDTTAPPAGDPATPATTQTAGTPPPGMIVLQDRDTLLASTMIGARIYNEASEDVGKINDIIIGLDGGIDGVVIAVGGFLGLGEKHVAIALDRLSVGQTETGEPRLILAASRADLEAAEPFVTARAQRAAEDAAAAQTGVDQSTAAPEIAQ